MSLNPTILPPFSFACPVCGTPLEWVTPKQQMCSQDRSLYRNVEGIWRFLPPERLDYYHPFIEEYEAVRRAEGRGSKDPAYYPTLPFTNSDGKDPGGWRMRTQSYQALMKRILYPLENQAQDSLFILDLGAGNGWLSNRLAQHGHWVAAVDLLVNNFDGLGVHCHYDSLFTPVQAEFDRLPFTSRQFDLVIFNASFHYSTNYIRTLRESLRVLKPVAPVVILDSPIYKNASSGVQMVQEREAVFTRKFGFPSNALPSKNYLTYQGLKDLEDPLSMDWRIHSLFYGLGWSLRPVKARLLGQREPAQFRLIVGRRRPPPRAQGPG